MFILVTFAVGTYYLWAVRAAGDPFYWRYDLGGYYDYLGRGFSQGHLYVPIDPSPKLLALKNPWDPAVDDTLKMADMALFHGRYYLYHGAGPAFMLFTPWRLVTGHDLPENFALFLLCFGGFLFSCGTLHKLFTLARVKPGPLLLTALLLALGVCQSVPYLLNRVWVYEIAIGGGYFCISAAVFFLARGMRSRRSVYWLAGSGLMFGLAIFCRPHLGLVAAIALAGLAVYLTKSRSFISALRTREFIAFVVPLTLAGAAVATYNYRRFGDPFEFGIRYLLTGADQNRIKLTTGNVLPGLYYMLFCPPDFSPVFPIVRLVLRYPFNSLAFPFPAGYFIEPIAGGLYVAPIIAALAMTPWAVRLVMQREPENARTFRFLMWTILASSAAVLLFLAATGFSTQRYQVDFLPLAVLGGAAAFGVCLARSTGFTRSVLSVALAVVVAYSVVANLALGIVGPYDEMVRKRPASYLRIARWLTPIEQFLPTMKPSISVGFIAEFVSQPDGFQEPLVTMGQGLYRHFIFVEHLRGRLRIISQSGFSTVSQEIEEPGNKPVEFEVTYSPDSGRMTTAANGHEILIHEIGILVTAPAQVTVGENRIEMNLTVRRFTGRIRSVRKIVRSA